MVGSAGLISRRVDRKKDRMPRWPWNSPEASAKESGFP